MQKLLLKYKELIMYIIFGVLTTLVNYASYEVSSKVLDIYYIISAVIAWMLAVLFAFVTNKLFVFESRCLKPEVVLREFVTFVSCRVVSGIMDVSLMWIMVELFKMNDSLVKLLTNFIVVVVNYLFSKLLIFRKK